MKTVKTYRLFWLVVLITFAAGFSTAQAYTVNCHARSVTTGWVPYNAEVMVFEVDPLPGDAYSISPTPIATATVEWNGHFDVTFTWPSGPGFEIDGPDLIFLLTQNINESVETIYEETTSEAHWNVTGPYLKDTLWITSELAACIDPAVGLTPPVNPGKRFLFTRVGKYPTADIDCSINYPAGNNPTGYCHPRKAPFNNTFNLKGTYTDQPFGGTLNLFGYFGNDCKDDSVLCYKVLYFPEGGTAWKEIETPLPNYWYDMSAANPLNWHWVSESMGPDSAVDQSGNWVHNLYRIPYFEKPNTPWSWFYRIARFNTTVAPNGLCSLTVVGYKKQGNTVEELPELGPNLEIDQNYGKIVLRIDNTPPTVDIIALKKNGTPIPVCEILNFSNPGDKIKVEFCVWDEQGHLREYALDAMFGHNCRVLPRPVAPDSAADDYDNDVTGPIWQGSKNKITIYEAVTSSPPNHPVPGKYLPGTGPACVHGVMPTCAYQFRLHASKRTTNGYGLIYPWVEDTWHVTIQR